jgi:hypothetical protein
MYFSRANIYIGGKRLRHCGGSIPDGVLVIFHSHNPSDRTMVLGSTQPLRETSTRNISLHFHGSAVMKWESLNHLKPSEPVQTYNRYCFNLLAFNIIYIYIYIYCIPGTYYTGSWVGPRADLDMCEKPRPSGIPSPDLSARSQSLYRQSYPGPLVTV